MLDLMKIRGFFIFLMILFINATVDLAHKITIQNVLLKSFDQTQLIILSAFVNALILLPFIFLFSPSGFVNDKYSKTKVIQLTAASSIVLTVFITLSYWQGWFVAAFLGTLLLAMQSAIYSPAKYGMIKNLVGVEHLGKANGYVQALTVVAILLSSLIFSFIFENLYGDMSTPSEILPNITFIGILLIVLSVTETYLAFKLPHFDAQNPKQSFDFSKYINFSYLKTNIKHITSDRNIWLSIIGLSIFWGISQTIVAAFPAHYKYITQDSDTVIIQMILAVSAIGLVVGSLVAGKLSKMHIEIGVVPIGALGVFFSVLFFTYAQNAFFMMVASLLFGFFGGLFIVPLNALIQFFAKNSSMGKVLAGNNFVQNIVMLFFLTLTILFTILNFSTTDLFLFAAIVALFGFLYTVKQMPHLFARSLLTPILKTRYRLHVEGLKNLPPSGGVLLLGNHISWIDWLVIQAASPRAITFVMHKSIYELWYLKWFLKMFKMISISQYGSKGYIASIRQRLDNGEVIALFPEGHISYNGQLGEFKKGFELAMKDINHPIIPFYIRGLWGSSFSRAQKHYKQISSNSAKRDIIISFGQKLSSTATAQEVKQAVFKLSYFSWEKFISEQKPVYYEWIKNAKSNLTQTAISDATGMNLSNAKFITSVLLFNTYFNKYHQKDENIGVMLPSSVAGAIANLALMTTGKVAINLNYTFNQETINHAVNKGKINTIISSIRFLQQLEKKGFIFDEAFKEKIIYVENIAKGFSVVDKLIFSVQTVVLPTSLLQMLYFKKRELNDIATVLFSSGSESKPKGIALSHKNILANIKQISDLLNFQKEDVMLNSLPIFHSFGLTVTTLLPLVQGVSIVCIPDPTDAVSVGKMAAKHKATILFGTSTFFRLYNKNKKLQPLMFESVRMVVSGAEKLNPEVKKEFREKFGLDIYEGYGATETAPVVSVNLPNVLEPDSLATLIFNKNGSVGLPIPGTFVKIVDPDTLEEVAVNEEGLIIIGGSQVMMGYYDDEEKTNEAIAVIEGIRYYKSGDKGYIDENGFLTIVDRYSRFAKVGGEMISLGNLEEKLIQLFNNEIEVSAVNVPSDKKGEEIVLLYASHLDEKEIKQKIKESEIPRLMHPAAVFQVEKIPKLASGKTDFGTVKKLVNENLV